MFANRWPKFGWAVPSLPGTYCGICMTSSPTLDRYWWSADQTERRSEIEIGLQNTDWPKIFFFYAYSFMLLLLITFALKYGYIWMYLSANEFKIPISISKSLSYGLISWMCIRTVALELWLSRTVSENAEDSKSYYGYPFCLHCLHGHAWAPYIATPGRGRGRAGFVCVMDCIYMYMCALKDVPLLF